MLGDGAHLPCLLHTLIYFFLIEVFRIEASSKPVHHLFMLGVIWVFYHFQHSLIPPYSTAIFWRPCSLPAYASGVAYPFFSIEHLLYQDFVLPAVPKIILIDELALWLQS